MNVCAICMADGVLEVNGAWYCIDHMHHGLEAVAETITQLSRHRMTCDADTLIESFNETLDDYEYKFPDDE